MIFAHSLFPFAPLEMLLKQFGLVRNLTGAKKCRVGDLRRSAVANWVQKLSLQAVRQLAGESDISTTRKYYWPLGLKVLSNILLSRNENY